MGSRRSQFQDFRRFVVDCTRLVLFCFLYISDGYSVYPCFISDCDHLVSKTAMTRVEGENSRLRHYLARLHSPNVLLLQIN